MLVESCGKNLNWCTELTINLRLRRFFQRLTHKIYCSVTMTTVNEFLTWALSFVLWHTPSVSSTTSINIFNFVRCEFVHFGLRNKLRMPWISCNEANFTEAQTFFHAIWQKGNSNKGLFTTRLPLTKTDACKIMWPLATENDKMSISVAQIQQCISFVTML